MARRASSVTKGMTRTDVLRMVKRRAMAAGLPASTCCHTFRATGITAYLEAGGTIENAQAIAASRRALASSTTGPAMKSRLMRWNGLRYSPSQPAKFAARRLQMSNYESYEQVA